MMTLAAWLHDWDPFAFRIAGGFGIGWYGLSYIAGFALAWFAVRWLARRAYTPVPADRAFDVVMLAALGAVIGGRLGYVLLYRPALLVEFTGSPPFWGLPAINQGGMASHGGMVGVAIAAVLVSRGFKDEAGQRVGRLPLMHVADLFALAAPTGLLLGRLANFVNGELLGRVIARPGEAAPWWAVRFPQEIASEHDAGLRTPEQDAALSRLIEDYRLPDQPFGVGLDSMLGELRRGSPDVAARLEPLVSARHPSQLYQAAAEGLIVGIVVWCVARKPRLPGVAAAWFLITYGTLRIATEFVRLPDAHLAVARPLGFSRGQWLSGAMIALGVVLLVVVARRGGARLGGWRETAGDRL
ncbi:MAG: prolipoprotein diacylglyceryl transferase [Planctomycetota bacterium]